MLERVIYQIKNIENGKRYIGSTKNKEERWNYHKKSLKNKNHINPYLQRSWNAHGKENFEFSVLEKVDKEADLLEKEQEYLDKEKPEYNILKNVELTPVQKGSGCREETIEKIRKALEGKEASKKTREKLSRAFKNREFTEEWKEKISEALKGREITEEWKEKISEANKGKDGLVGGDNPLSKLTKKKVKVIKHLLSGGQFTQAQISRMYGVSVSAISAIKVGRNWSHVSID